MYAAATKPSTVPTIVASPEKAPVVRTNETMSAENAVNATHERTTIARLRTTAGMLSHTPRTMPRYRMLTTRTTTDSATAMTTADSR